VDTYYTSPAMDAAYAQSNLDDYGFIFTCLRSDQDAANSAPTSDEAIHIYCPGNAAFKPILHLTGEFFDCTGSDGFVIPEFGNWQT
jgi:hypothetical protein